MGNIIVLAFLTALIALCAADETVYSCGGFIKSSVPIPLNDIMVSFYFIILIDLLNMFSQVRLYTPGGNLKYETDVAPNNGYYMLPVYSKGVYVIRVHAPNGWAFKPDHYELTVNGVDDDCSMDKDINFDFLGLPVNGQVRVRHQHYP